MWVSLAVFCVFYIWFAIRFEFCGFYYLLVLEFDAYWLLFILFSVFVGLVFLWFMLFVDFMCFWVFCWVGLFVACCVVIAICWWCYVWCFFACFGFIYFDLFTFDCWGLHDILVNVVILLDFDVLDLLLWFWVLVVLCLVGYLVLWVSIGLLDCCAYCLLWVCLGLGCFNYFGIV